MNVNDIHAFKIDLKKSLRRNYLETNNSNGNSSKIIESEEAFRILCKSLFRTVQM